MLDTEGLASKLNCRAYRPPSDGLHTFILPGGVNESAEQEITLRLANSDGERSGASMLINRKYTGRGYGKDHRVPTAQNCVTFTASTADLVVGTLSLTVDSREGLACDSTFKDELDRFRAFPGAKLCELTKFACETSKPSLRLLASMFHIIFIYGTYQHKCTDLFIEVNPRHRHFYERMLGFKSVGAVRTYEAVGAPSHLMWLKIDDIRRLINGQGSSQGEKSHSLYPFFFSEKEEIGIYRRLMSSTDPRLASVMARDRAVEVDNVAVAA